ncbi:MAG: PAS domain-containing protein [Burkholderiales bacterium]|nr:PAS domain-containing protein [Burkholderiales bacterium]
MPAPALSYEGLDLLPAPVLLLDGDLAIVHVNPSAEVLIESSLRAVRGHPVSQFLAGGGDWDVFLIEALAGRWGSHTRELSLSPHGREAVPVSCTVTPVDAAPARLLVELRPLDQQRRIERDERLQEQSDANRELIRNLAHEIKNPLGGIRGAAQLLEGELPDASLREYTQVIIKESDRLRSLMDRMLAPHRPPNISEFNIHEVLERVRSLIAAEFPQRVLVIRDYDASLPDLRGDKERLIQAVLNIARNAAEALCASDTPDARILLLTRVARNVIILKQRYRLALELHVQDNGPGIPESIRERMFYPLVSGRAGGSGLGLTLAQTFIAQHHGSIECASRPGETRFTILLPLP